MKLLRYGADGAEKPGLLDANGVIRDLSAHCRDIDGGLLEDLSVLDGINPESLPAVKGGQRIGPCVTGVGKFVCIGVNYSDHAAETNSPIPSEPVVFLKANSAISGPNDDVVRPQGAEKLDWELELGIVMGRTAKNVSEEDALQHVAGYCIVNDISERAFQHEREGQWTKGKSCDTFGPIGPYLVTKDEIADPHDLSMWLDVNGDRRQQGSTRTMISGVPFLVSYLSRLFTLHPGDVISTGTPPGVGMGMTPPQYLSVGDMMELHIDGLGRQRQVVVDESRPAQNSERV